MQSWDFLYLLPLGLLAGASGGLLGIGGSVVIIPGMVLIFGAKAEHLYQATAMIVNFFVVAPAVLRHLQAQATLRSVTRLMIPSAIIGSVAGVFLSELPVFRGSGQGYLQLIFAAFLGYVLAHNLWRLHSKRRAPAISEPQAAELSKPLIVTLVGLPTGLLAGLLGIGGGVYAVPTQQVCLKIPLPNAIANSASTILWSSVVGAVLKNMVLGSHGYSWSQAVVMAMCLIPTAMLGSWVAAGKVHKWPVGIIRVAFAILLSYCSVRLFMAGWLQIHS